MEAAAIFASTSSLIENQVFEEILAKYLHAAPVYNEVAAFIQDEWKLNERLSLSLGLRWERNPPPVDAHGDDAFTLLGDIAQPSTLSLAPRGTPLWKTSDYNFAPRVGVAWQLHNKQGRETVVRAGAGVFFDTDNEFASLGFSGLGFFADQVLSGTSLPVTRRAIKLLHNASRTLHLLVTAYAFPAHLQLPYTLQWNVAIQQAFGKQQALSITYVGSRMAAELLQSQTRTVDSLNPDFSSIAYLATGVTSNFQALEVQFQRSIQRGIQALASYTWAHSLDYGSTYSALTVTRGNSDFDLRHNLQAGLSWEAPQQTRKSFLRVVSSGWGVDGRVMLRTAFPITITGNYLTDPATGRNYYSSVNIVPNVPIYLRGPQYPGGRIVNARRVRCPTERR